MLTGLLDAGTTPGLHDQPASPVGAVMDRIVDRYGSTAIGYDHNGLRTPPFVHHAPTDAISAVHHLLSTPTDRALSGCLDWPASGFAGRVCTNICTYICAGGGRVQ